MPCRRFQFLANDHAADERIPSKHLNLAPTPYRKSQTFSIESLKTHMNIVIVTPGHPSPRKKSFPPALTAPYLAAIATPFADHLKIVDLAVQPFDLYAPDT